MQESPTLENIQKLPFFFILGRPRSGTTLLRTLLDVHPNITIPLENSGMIHLYFKYRRVRRWDRKKLKDLHSDFRNLNFIEYWNLDWECIEGIFDHASNLNLTFHEIIRVYYYHYQSEFVKEEIRYLGDKSPLNSLYPKELYRVFPNAKYIHLVRDYRANLASMSKHDVFSPSSTAMLMQWKKSVNQINKLALANPQSILQIRYEDLVLHPEHNYEKICNFIDVRYIPELLDPDYRKNAISNIYNKAFLDQWQPDLSGKISTSNIDKWEKELSTEAVRKADYIAGKTGQLFQYESISRGYGLPFILITEMKKFLFHLNEMMRYLYDRLPYRMKTRIKNRKFILSYHLIQFYKRQFGKH
jgi:hypothetical protein